ncbi:Uncharacterised protein [Mycobacteroides abscessus subsp. abscessus]|nr:Uncharacterised protein [Mycobacteroides abscessus subsp. abscessus]
MSKLKDFPLNKVENDVLKGLENLNCFTGIVYSAETHLMDSYWCLSQRPDMAFTFLWKSINAIYNKYYFEKFAKETILTSMDFDGREGDAKKLELLLKGLLDKLEDRFDYNGNEFNLLELIQAYVEKMPIKTLRFVSNYILNGYVLSEKIDFQFIRQGLKASKNPYISSQFTTFKKIFENNLNIISNTFGQSYSQVTSITSSVENYNIEVKALDKKKSREISYSLATKLKELLVNREVEVTNSDKTSTYKLKIENDLEYLQMIFTVILYAIRNSSFHGNSASRFESKYFNEESVLSSIYTYLLGHLFLSLCMYISGDLEKDDLKINFINLELINIKK